MTTSRERYRAARDARMSELTGRPTYHRTLGLCTVPGVVVALIGIAVNLLAARLLAGTERKSLNVEGAFRHVLTDLFAFIATAIAGAVILIWVLYQLS